MKTQAQIKRGQRTLTRKKAAREERAERKKRARIHNCGLEQPKVTSAKFHFRPGQEVITEITQVIENDT